MSLITGIHHITVMASDPKANLDFYTKVLGLRLIKKTVNFDDPSTYHFYFANYEGTPGTVLTFFPWPDLPKGRPGTGQVYATAFSVPVGALGFWRAHLAKAQVAFRDLTERFGEKVMSLADPDGLVIELIESANDQRPATPHPDVPADAAIRGFHSATLAVPDAKLLTSLLTEKMHYSVQQSASGRTRLIAGDGKPGTFIDLLVDPTLPHGLNGAGIVHHIAFRTPYDDTELTMQSRLSEAGYHVSPVMDRNYFHSIYYRVPPGILFEIATDQPGFAIDEPLAALGQSLKLPAKYEARRAEIEAALPRLA
jgi:glyoxalase family protein